MLNTPLPSQKLRRCSQRDRRGAATVEFALIAPLFFIFVSGIIECGQLFRIQHTLSTASRRGARASAMDTCTHSQVTEKCKKHCCEILGVNENDMTVEICVNGSPNTDLSVCQAGDEVRVTVSVPYSKAGVGFYANTFANSIVSSECTWEHE